MRNLTLITLLLLFWVLYSLVSKMVNYNNSFTQIVNEKNGKEEFDLYRNKPLLINKSPFCFKCICPCKNENKQKDLVELHNTKEITLGYFLML